MRNGAWSAGPVREVAPVVTGVPGVTVSGVSVERELPSSLPGQARSVGGLSAATATVTGHVGSGVTERVGTPWTRRDWPAPGTRVTVSASDGSNRHRLFTGKVDGSVSSLADLGVSVPLVDDTDRLSAPVSHNAVFRVMPPLSTRGYGDRRLTGMLSTWVTDLAARTAGYYSTPPMGGYCVVSAPLAGSTWPERGNLSWSGRFDADKDGMNSWKSAHPGAFVWDDAIYTSDILAEYVPDQYNQPWAGGITAERPLNLTIGLAPNPDSSGYIDVRWSGADWTRFIQLTVSSTRSLSGRIVSDNNYDTANVVTWINGADAPGWRFATLTVSRESTNVLRFTLETDTGVTHTGTTSAGGTAIRDTMWDRARVYVPSGVGVNGAQVGYGSTPPARGFSKTFLHNPDSPLSALDVLPHLSSVPARELLNQQAEVECAAVWIDEDGVLRWLGHQRMVDGPVVRTLSSSELADVEISVDSQDVRRQVTGKYNTWAASTSSQSRIIVYEGSQGEYEKGDHAEEVITPPSEEEWVMVDSTLAEVYGGSGSDFFNQGQGSFHGYVALTSKGDELSTGDDQGMTEWAFNAIGPGAWKWEFTVNSLPSGADRVKTATRSEDSSFIKPAYRDRGLPMLRAMGKATCTEDTYTPGLTGPSWASDLEVDFGWWVQRRSQVVTKVQRIAAELRKPRATLARVSVLADPRLQLGDKVRIVEAARSGISVVGIVSAIPQEVEAGEHTMTLELNILEVTTPHVTLDEFDAWYSGLTLDQLDQKFSGQTLAQIDANPLQ